MPPTNLKLGDPLVLTLAADARLGAINYVDDHIWELNLSSGEPPSIAIQTTFGMRARSFRIFPRFILQDVVHTDPSTFTASVIFKYLAPNYLHLVCTPFPGINVEIEYWVPTSQTLAGRARIINAQSEPATLSLEWAAVLTPDASGQRMAPMDIGLSHLLAGKTTNLAPVLYLTGIVQPGLGPYPALSHSLELAPNEMRPSTWVSTAMATPEMAFAQARQIAARNWDAETAHLELMNSGQLEIHTGLPDWDAAFALTQTAALRSFLPASETLPNPSFVLTRAPDHGFSHKGDGTDYPLGWAGQNPLEAYALASLLPGAPQFVKGLLRNFLSTQNEDGSIDTRPGLAGQRAKMLAASMLASLAWQTYQASNDETFLAESSRPAPRVAPSRFK